jgi:Tol biopolymer transport system component
MEQENLDEADIRKQLSYILDAHVLSPHQERLLNAIVERTLAGKFEDLTEKSLASDFFKKDYDSRQHSGVRSAVNKLRAKLSEYYSQNRAKDVARIDIPVGAYRAKFSYLEGRQTPNAKPEGPQSGRIPPWAKVATGLAILGCVVATIALWRTPKPLPDTGLPVQMTADEGFSARAAISADGRTLVYSSDRGKDGIVHIWLKDREDEPRQLTFGSANEFDPDISPDRKLVVFRSTKDGSSLYLVPTAGGDPSLLVKGAYAPRFSPNGKWVAYSGTSPNRSGVDIFIVSVVSPHLPRRVDFGVSDAAYPVWSPDSRHIVFIAHPGQETDWDYWVASVDSAAETAAKRVGIQSVLKKQGLPALHWLNDAALDWVGDTLIFEIIKNDPGNVFQVRLDPRTWHPASQVRPFDPHLEAGAVRIARDRHWAVYSSGRYTRSIWSLDLGSPNRSPFQRILEDVTIRGGAEGTWPGLSRDGRMLCFLTERTGKTQICCRDIQTGRERLVDARPRELTRTLPNRDGQRVAFLRGDGPHPLLVVREIEGEAEREISSGCPVLLDWSADDQFFLCSQSPATAASHSLYRIAVATGHASGLVSTSHSSIIHAQLAPDGNWLTLVVDSGESAKLKGYLVPIQPAVAEPTRWIEVVQESFNLSLHWSPDGSQVFYWHTQDGFRCLWAQRLDPKTKLPLGKPVALLHRHGYQAYPHLSGTLAVGGTAGHTRMVMTLSDSRANIWRMNIPE